jgi:predicted O-methyltransferase YrrM
MAFSFRDLCGPNPRPMTEPEALMLRRFAKEVPPNGQIVNIGADVGISALAMADVNPECIIFSVDVDACEKETENLHKANIRMPGRVIRVLGDSATIGRYWPYFVDLVYVDGNHSEAGVAADINAWGMKIRNGGILAFHDYIPDPIPPEIKGRVAYAVDKSDIVKTYFEEVACLERLKVFRRRSKL